MKKFLQLIIACGALTGACTHTVHKNEIPLEEYKRLRADIKQSCNMRSCRLGNCWEEQEGFYMCEVLFREVSYEQRKSMLERAAKRTNQRGVKFGFCGQNREEVSNGTKAAIVGLAIGSAISGGPGIFIWSPMETVNYGPMVTNVKDFNPKEACFKSRSE